MQPYADISADYVDSTTAYDPRPNIDQLTSDSGIMTSVVTTGSVSYTHLIIYT